MMASIYLPLSLTIIAIIFVTLYIFPLLKLLESSFHCLQYLISRRGSGNNQQLIERTSSRVDPPLQALAHAIEKESTFSADWWCHDKIFQLERRAIFSKSWIYAAHRSLFSKPGDYVTVNIAGFSFFLILGKDLVLRAFHNICRHRAYEVTRKERGSSTVLGCRYHGWSYDTKGHLTKAPEFDTVPEFDKKKNGLWEIHVKVSDQGLVFVNLDAAKTVEDLAIVELNAGTGYWNLSQSSRMTEWRYEGDFNWKIALTTSYRDSNAAHIFEGIRREGHWISGVFGSIFKHKRQVHRRIDLLTTLNMFPSASIWLVIRITPLSVTKTVMGYELYAQATHQSRSLEASIQQLKRRTLSEMERLRALQNQLIEGSLSLEHGQFGQQNAVNELLTSHRKLERSEGTEIKPAARQIGLSGKGEEDVNLCKRLEKALGNAGSRIERNSFPTPESLEW